MNDLREVVNFIKNARTPLECVAIEVGAWERIRDECREFCEENDEPFTTNPNFYAPNFLVMGIPVIAAGRA